MMAFEMKTMPKVDGSTTRRYQNIRYRLHSYVFLLCLLHIYVVVRALGINRITRPYRNKYLPRCVLWFWHCSDANEVIDSAQTNSIGIRGDDVTCTTHKIKTIPLLGITHANNRNLSFTCVHIYVIPDIIYIYTLNAENHVMYRNVWLDGLFRDGFRLNSNAMMESPWQVLCMCDKKRIILNVNNRTMLSPRCIWVRVMVMWMSCRKWWWVFPFITTIIFSEWNTTTAWFYRNIL